ncbi:hypothetical protein [Mycoplasma sp. VS30B]
MITDRWNKTRSKKINPENNSWLLSERLEVLKKSIFKQQFSIFIAHFIYQALFITFLVLGIVNAKGQIDSKQQTWYTYIVVAVLLFAYYNFWVYVKAYQLHFRLHTVFQNLHWNSKTFERLMQFDWVITFLPISSFLYKWFILEKNLVPQNKNINSLQDIVNINYLINLTSDSRFSKLVKDSFTFSIQDLTMSSMLLGLFLIVTTLTKFTGLSKVGLSFEYVFYIVFALFFPTFKAIILGLIADFASLLFTGFIWSWFWMYALVPVAVVLISKLFLWMYKSNTIAGAITTTILLTLIFIALLVATSYAAYLHNIDPTAGNLKNFFGVDKKNGNAQGWRITRTFGVSTLSDTVIWSMVGISGAALIGVVILASFLIKGCAKKSEEEINRTKSLILMKKILISFALVVSVIVLARWIYGPYVYIQYANYFNGKNYLLNDKYIYFMIPIVLRSFISIPIYTVLLIMIYSTLDFFKERILHQKFQTTY